MNLQSILVAIALVLAIIVAIVWLADNTNVFQGG